MKRLEFRLKKFNCNALYIILYTYLHKEGITEFLAIQDGVCFFCTAFLAQFQHDFYLVRTSNIVS